MPFSGNGEASGEVVFAGFGFRFSNDTLEWDDYAHADVEGKIAMILKGNPDPSNTRSAFINYSQDRDKVLLASDMGAAGVIFVSGEKNDPDDNLTSLKSKEHQLNLPVIHVKRFIADQILTKAGMKTVNELESLINGSSYEMLKSTGLQLEFATDIAPEHMETFNSMATLRGSLPSVRSQYIIIGAHHDHLGMGGIGSSSRQPDTSAVHYGADDNASGVAGVLEISEKLVSMSPDRSIIFSTFGAEEMGLIGSRYLVENPPIETDSIQVMINLDMVGRLNEDHQLQIGGVGTSPVFRQLLDSVNSKYDFDLKLSNEGYGPSDHAAFYAADIPVLFISTGPHAEYHTPGDSFDKINYEGAAKVYAFVSDLAFALANYPEKIAFSEAGPKVRSSSMGRMGKISFRLMPDMNYDGDEGMPVLFITSETGPAAIGGIKKGDIITAIDGKKVGNVYDYMSRVGQLKEGQSVIVTVLRDGDTMDLLLQL
jgi:hypothetical protein